MLVFVIRLVGKFFCLLFRIFLICLWGFNLFVVFFFGGKSVSDLFSKEIVV